MVLWLTCWTANSSHYYIHFQANTHWERHEPPLSLFAMDKTIIVFQQE